MDSRREIKLEIRPTRGTASILSQERQAELFHLARFLVQQEVAGWQNESRARRIERLRFLCAKISAEGKRCGFEFHHIKELIAILEPYWPPLS